MTWWMSPGCLNDCPPGPYLGEVTWPCPPNQCGWGYPPYPMPYAPPGYAPYPALPPGNPYYPFPAPPFVAGQVGHGDDHGGACCGSCASGGGCESACPSQAPVGETCCGSCAMGGACETSCQEKKAIVGALYVSDAELDALGAEIAKMGADVEAAATAERTAQPGGKRSGSSGGDVAVAETGILAIQHKINWDLCKEQKGTWNASTFQCDFAKKDPTYWDMGYGSYGDAPNIPGWPLTKFMDDEWRPFQNKWNDYRNDTIHEPTTYDIMRTQFSTLRDRWTGPLGQQTRANVPKPLSETSEFPWGWVILGGVIVAIPFILPVLTGLYLVLAKGKSLGSLATAAQAAV